MEAILLGIYCFFVWLIFIKFKLLPWTTPWKVTVAIIPVVGLAVMILLLNIGAPSSADVRVIKYVVPIVSQVRGRVIDVPADNNKPMKKGDVLFRIDPTPYQNRSPFAGGPDCRRRRQDAGRSREGRGSGRPADQRGRRRQAGKRAAQRRHRAGHRAGGVAGAGPQAPVAKPGTGRGRRRQPV